MHDRVMLPPQTGDGSMVSGRSTGNGRCRTGEIGGRSAGARVWRAGSLFQRTRMPNMENSLGATYCSFEDLLAQSDYVSIHLQ